MLSRAERFKRLALAALRKSREFAVVVTSTPIVARTRRLTARWTEETEQVLLHVADAAAEARMIAYARRTLNLDYYGRQVIHAPQRKATPRPAPGGVAAKKTATKSRRGGRKSASLRRHPARR